MATENKPEGPRAPTEENYDIRIARDGTWYHEGTPIGRTGLVKLFASVLRRDDKGDYWLITPAERGRIVVEDAPFLAVELQVRGTGPDQELAFRTNLDDWVVAGPDHPLRTEIDPDTGEPRPYILVRDNLEARITRPVFYELVDRAEMKESGEEIQVGIWSRRTYFKLGTLSNLKA